MEDPIHKFKKGAVRQDGFRFWQYRIRNGKKRELWINPTAFEKFMQDAKRLSSQWAKRNRDKIRPLDAARHREARKKNPDHFKALRSKNYYKNREAILLQRREYYLKDKEYFIKKSLMWQSANPEKANAKNSKRRALQFSSIGDGHDPLIEQTLQKQCKSLYLRLGIKFEVDHIIPISKGGVHHHLNLQVITATWNRRKHNKDNSVIPNCWHLNHRCNISVD
jgi:5-methylcytosine-specific restriction endonuclease McrA